MKTEKIWLNALAVSVVLICFGLSTAHAQPDLSRWENQWFSIAASLKGWEIEGGTTTILTSSGGTKGFFGLGALNAGSLEANLWNDTWVLLATGSCDYVAGSDLDFTCELYQDGILPFDARIDTFIRITGKLDTKVAPPQPLKSATLKSSGGLLIGHVDEVFPDTLSLGGFTLAGKWLNLTAFCKGDNLTTPPCLP